MARGSGGSRRSRSMPPRRRTCPRSRCCSTSSAAPGRCDAMDRARRRKLVEDLAAKIRRSRRDVRAIVLFGSVARGDDLPDSDVDLIVVAGLGPWKPQKFTLGGVLFNVYWKRWPGLLRDMLEPGPGAERHGFLEGEALYDPDGLLTKLRSLAGRLPEAWYRESAEAELN